MEIFKEVTIFKNIIFNLAKTFSSVTFPVITFTYSARILGEEGIGKVSFVKSFITYFTMLALLGMNYYGTREAAKLRQDRGKLSKYVHEMLLINSITTALSYVLLFLAMMLAPKLHAYKELLLLSSLAIVLQGMGMEWLYQALEEYRYIAVRSILFQLGALVALFVFVRDADDVIPYASVSLAASSGTYVMNFINARKFIDLRWYGHYEIKKHLRPLLWLFAMNLSIELYTVLDSTMLGFLQGDAAVGRYTAAIKVNRLVNTLITAIGVVLIPRLSFYIGQGEKAKVNELIDKAYNYAFMLSIPAAVGLFMLSDEIILLFSGSAFHSAALTMRILTPIVLVIPFSVTTNQQTFIPMGKEKLILRSTLTGAITNFTFNSILIPRYAENGAAAATVAAETVVAIVCFINVKKYFNMKAVFKNYYQYWFAALPIPVVVTLARVLPVHYIWQMFIAIIVSAVCYFALMYKQKNEYLLQALRTLLTRTGRKASSQHKGKL